MIRTSRSPSRRTWFALGFATLAFLFGGCVYLRLLELKRQLADFERHFTLHTDKGLRLEFLHPVVLADDVRWMGFEPASIRSLGSAEQWHLRWVKQPPPESAEKNHFEISFDLVFAEGKLTALSIPENYFALFSKDVVIASIKSLGGAKVNKTDRGAQSAVSLAELERARPNKKMLTALLGEPTEEEHSTKASTLRYRCMPTAANGKGKELDIHLVFEPKTEALLRVTARLPFGYVDLDFAKPPAR